MSFHFFKAQTSLHIYDRWDRGQKNLAAIIVGVLSYLIALCVSFPGTMLHRNFYHTRMGDTLKLSHNLFARDLSEDIIAYRLTVPVLAKALHIAEPALLTILFQILPSIFTLAILFKLAANKLGPRLAFPITLAFGLSFLLFWTFYYGGLFDPLTHLCLAGVMTFSNPVLCFVLTVTGIFNDERFIIAVPFALLWHFNGTKGGSHFRRLAFPAAGVLCGIAISLAIRHALKSGLIGPGITVHGLFDKIWKECTTNCRPYDTRSFLGGWSVFALDTFMSFRWLWVPMLLFFFKPSPTFIRPYKILFWIAFIPAVLSTAMVMDITKSIGFLFPGVFFCVVSYVATQVTSPSCSTWLWRLVIAQVFTPVFCINGQLPAFWIPLPLELIRCTIIWIWNYDIVRDWILPHIHSDQYLAPIKLWRPH